MRPVAKRTAKIALVGATAVIGAVTIASVASQPAHRAPDAGSHASHASPSISWSAPSSPSSSPSAPAPAAVRTLLSFTGHGNESTPKFTSVGDFIVTYSYSGNVDNSIPGYPNNDNFISNMYTPPNGDIDVEYNGINDIQSSGHGNQRITGDDGVHYFTVQANPASTWTITARTAS